MSVRILGIAIFLLASWGIGGPFLGLPAIALVIWLWKRGSTDKKLKAAVEAESTNSQPDAIETNDWPAELVTVCSSLVGQSYFVGSLIPSQKLVGAASSYPPPGDGQILAIIDTTVMGSATDGLAIGRSGLGWKNFMASAVQLTWDQFSTHKITLAGSDVKIGSNAFQTTGSGIVAQEVSNFLLRLQEYAKSLADEERSMALSAQTPMPKKAKHLPPVAQSEKPVSINAADFDELLALPGIGAAEAQMIIKRRSERAFTSNVELADYLDLKPHIATKLDGTTVFEATSSASQMPPAELTPVVSNVPKSNPLGGRTID
jgi:DNA uptake protein ComE-like DNA-binding protein